MSSIQHKIIIIYTSFLIAIFGASAFLYFFYVAETVLPQRWYFPEFHYAITAAVIHFLFRLSIAPQRRIVLVLMATLVVCTASLSVDWEKRQRISQRETWGKASMDVVSWIEENTQLDDKIGTWAAGQIGFYANRSVYNLEGLVADAELLSYNKNLMLPDYLRKEGIRYVIQWFPKDEFPADQIPCRELTTDEWQKLYATRLYIFTENCNAYEIVKVLELAPPMSAYAVFFFDVS